MTGPDVAPLATLANTALSPPAAGDTANRWLTLAHWARTETVSVARLAEAHHDAIGILAEAGLEPRPGIYGVWASQGPSEVRLDHRSTAITGSKPFCSGLGTVDRALVIVRAPDGDEILAEVTAREGKGVVHDRSGWNTPALGETATGAILFEQHAIDRLVGEPGWYLDRPGFWHGAIGPAACWAGAALGLVDTARIIAGSSPYDDVARGELTAEAHLLVCLLRDAGQSADAHPHDVETARKVAYGVRYLIERSATRIADTFSRAFGPRPLVADRATAQRLNDLHLYLRQQHGLRDLAQLGQEDPA